jgi:hypothetical protein
MRVPVVADELIMYHHFDDVNRSQSIYRTINIQYDRQMPSTLIDDRKARLDSLTKTQRDRLAYIDFRLYFLGELRRVDLIERFGMGPAGATRDIAQYKTLAPSNLSLVGAEKVYVSSPQFEPVFSHSAERTLSVLAQGFGHGAEGDVAPLLRCEVPTMISRPQLSVLAPISRAIHRRKPVHIKYNSVDSGPSEREIVPFALVNNGVRWHTRAFDRKSNEFKDFVLTRMEDPTVIEAGELARHESLEHDAQWGRVVELELVVHPNHINPAVIARDYEMVESVLKVKVRATNAGYMLRLWGVDCSPDHSEDAKMYCLWLRNSMVLFGVGSAQLAPGYPKPVKSTLKR